MKKKVKNPWTLLFIFLLLAFLMSLFLLGYKRYVRYKENIAFEELSKQTELNPEQQSQPTELEESSEEIEQEEQNDEPVILTDYEKLYEENNDLYGWIRINDTVIDYPVMYSPYEPELYLHSDFSKNESVSGTPFILTPDTENIIIYAHNMKDRSMFGSLRNYKEPQYLQEHPYIEFDTIYEKSQYEIIAVSKAIAYYNADDIPEGAYLFYEHTSLKSEKEFNDYIDNAKANQYFDTGITASYGDKLITLCTCDYYTKNARLIIIAKKIQPK